VIIIGAEFNAILFPRAFLGRELSESATSIAVKPAELHR
jgi:hypothetical protein